MYCHLVFSIKAKNLKILLNVQKKNSCWARNPLHIGKYNSILKKHRAKYSHIDVEAGDISQMKTMSKITRLQNGCIKSKSQKSRGRRWIVIVVDQLLKIIWSKCTFIFSKEYFINSIQTSTKKAHFPDTFQRNARSLWSANFQEIFPTNVTSDGVKNTSSFWAILTSAYDTPTQTVCLLWKGK